MSKPQLADLFDFTKCIERIGTGKGGLIRRKAGQVVAVQPESQPESQPQAESIEQRVLGLLTKRVLSKSEISSALGQKEISGHLNQVIRVLLNDQTLEYTIPDKPKSRLQQYRLTEKGRLLLATSRK